MALMREGWSLFLLLLVVIAGFIFAGGSPVQETDPELRKLFRIEAKEFRTPAGAIELESIRAFPPGGDEPDAIYIGAAQNFAEDRQGRIFIPDWRSDEVLVFNRNGKIAFKFGRTGQGPGEFSRPTNLYTWDDRVLVREASTNRFQLFDLEGKYLSGFAASKSHHDFCVRGGRSMRPRFGIVLPGPRRRSGSSRCWISRARSRTRSGPFRTSRNTILRIWVRSG